MEENNKYCSRGQYFKVILNQVGGGGHNRQVKATPQATQPCLRHNYLIFVSCF